MSDLLFEFQDDLTVGFVQQAFVRCEPLGFIFGVEIVRIGFEKDVEDVAVAFGNIFHHRAQRVVAGFEPGVFAPQLIGGVLELVFDGRVEEEREPDVVEDGCAEPHQYVKRDADRLLFGRARCGVFDRSAGGRRIGGVDASDIQGVGREQSPVNEVVAVVYFVQFALLRADLVLKEPVFEDQLRIFAQDAVHFRRVEDIREDDVDDRYCDEDDEDFANDTVGAQAERDRDHLMSGRNHLTGQGVGIERLLFSCHDLKNSLEVMQN